MYQYIGIIWDHRDESAARKVNRLYAALAEDIAEYRCISRSEGLAVFHKSTEHSANREYTIANNGGVVVGRIFRHGEEVRQSAVDGIFDEKAAQRIMQTQGRALIENYWGRYVAFVRDREYGRCHVIRDPTGAIPCFLTRWNGLQIVFSDIDDLRRIGINAFSINWHHVAAYVWYSRLLTRHTGFEEVMRLQPGECVTVGMKPWAWSFYWHPVALVKSAVVEQSDEARTLLKRVVTNSITSWASCYRNIFLQLSGGLDSSIVASGLAAIKGVPEVVCYNYYTDRPEGDERRFARMTADRFSFKLIVDKAEATTKTLPDMLGARPSVCPSVMPFMSAAEERRAELVTTYDADAVFTGQGGDHLFGRRRHPLIAGEYIRRHGLDRGLWKVAMETSRLTGKSVWAVLATALGDGLLRRPYDPHNALIEAPMFMDRGRKDSIARRDLVHPWVDDAASLPGMQRQRIFELTTCPNQYLTAKMPVDYVHPIISQPVIECCLRIPTYVLTHRGRERGLAREAFSSQLPHAITSRTGKGATTAFWSNIVHNDIDFVREFLFDGHLVANGVLDRTLLTQHFKEKRFAQGHEWRPLLNCVKGEAWVRSSLERSQQSAVAA